MGQQVGGSAFPMQEAVEAACAKLAGDGVDSADARSSSFQ